MTGILPSPHRSLLWLYLGLPSLPLEALGLVDRQHACVIGTEGRAPRVLMGNCAAHALGVAPGMKLNAVYALGDIEIHARRPSAEEHALRSLAAWCGQFTSMVSLAPPDGLLLEVGKSLALFGGVTALLEQVRPGLLALGYHPRLALAPTPLGATFLARADQELVITDKRALRARLAPLPLAVLPVGEAVKEALAGLGLRYLGDCLGLPRAGLARRFGQEFVGILDRALGRQPDPRSAFQPPPRFERRLELVHEIEDAQALLFVSRRLLLELSGFLRARAAGAQEIDWTLFHHGRRESCLKLRLLTPSRDPEHLTYLLRARLERLELSAPVCALRLVVAAVAPLAGSTLPLLPGSKQETQESSTAFIERLRARLGTDAVCGLSLVAEHRPECAWHPCAPGEPSPALRFRRRPLWLLREPRRLELRTGRPYLGGDLELLDRGERIEGGWWEGHDIGRDYFVARRADGGCFWIFRELESKDRWFLHGIFE